MPLIPALGVLFIVLKLMGYIAWSWWWVLLPIYGTPVLLLAILLAGTTALTKNKIYR